MSVSNALRDDLLAVISHYPESSANDVKVVLQQIATDIGVGVTALKNDGANVKSALLSYGGKPIPPNTIHGPLPTAKVARPVPKSTAGDESGPAPGQGNAPLHEEAKPIDPEANKVQPGPAPSEPRDVAAPMSPEEPAVHEPTEAVEAGPVSGVADAHEETGAPPTSLPNNPGPAAAAPSSKPTRIIQVRR